MKRSAQLGTGPHVLRARARRVYDVERWTEWSVNCPRRGRVGLEVCATCPSCERVVLQEGKHTTALIVCRVPPPVAQQRLRLVVAPERRIGALISGECVRLAAELELEPVTTLFVSRELECAVVVDGAGRALGRLSARELLRAHWSGAAPARTVADVMSPLELTLHEDLDVASARSLLSRRGLERALVVNGSGRALGWLSALDLAHTS